MTAEMPGRPDAGGDDATATLPEIDPHDWASIAPHFAALSAEALAPATVPAWLARWSGVLKIVREARSALYRERSRDLTVVEHQRAYRHFEEAVYAPVIAANQALAAKLLALPDWDPAPEHRQILRQWRNAADLAGAGNAALEAAIEARTSEYDRIRAAMRVTIDGQEIAGPDLLRRLEGDDRADREAAWRARQRPWREARATLDALALEVLARRRQLARNAGLPDYRAYRWRELGRLDYTPADCLRFHEAVADEFVPLAARRHEARRRRLGVATLRPWDLWADPAVGPSVDHFPDVAGFEEAMAGVFARLDPEVGDLFARMRRGFLDLGWRKGKQTGGEEWVFPISGLPYAIVGADGTDGGVNLVMHEIGHAYHDYLALTPADLIWKRQYPDEFAEFAAIAMTHFARPYLARDRGGFLSPAAAARARSYYFDELIVGGIGWGGLPDLSLADLFQHWVYAEAPEEVRPADLDAKWAELAARFTPWVDWSGLEEERASGWQRSAGFFGLSFYVVNYELAHLGALQALGRAQADPAAAWRDYRAALALGNTRSLPELFAAAGTRLPFDRETVRAAARIAAAQLAD